MRNKCICKDVQSIVEETYLQVYIHSYKCYVYEVCHKTMAKTQDLYLPTTGCLTKASTQDLSTWFKLHESVLSV